MPVSGGHLLSGRLLVLFADQMNAAGRGDHLGAQRCLARRAVGGALGRSLGAFASGDYRKLAGCFEDRLHQPYRAKLMPFLDDVIAAGCSAGALGGWLSGAGSTIACAALRRPDNVANAMIAACGLESACAVVVRADNAGVKIA